MQAIAYATQTIESGPTGVDGCYWRALASRRIYAIEDAQRDIDALLACTSHTAIHFAHRSFAHCIKREYELAIAECSKVLRENNSVKEVYFYRAWAYDDLKNLIMQLPIVTEQ